ncbi:MAG: sulfotransferase domain-containing protein [Bacteroidota bacterium]
MSMIWLASFPRSGNTFLRNVLYELYGLESSAISEKTLMDPAKALQKPVVKTHLRPHEVLALAPDVPKVYLVRDGRDALVSLAYHRSNIIAPGSSYRKNLMDAFLAREGTFFGGWHQNVLEWLFQADLIIRFEDLIEDPAGQAERFRKLVDLPEARLDQLPTFDSQKFGSPKYGPKRGKTELFFRKGKIGDWKDEMPWLVKWRFWRKNAPLMKLLGYGKKGEVLSMDELAAIQKQAATVFPQQHCKLMTKPFQS